MFQTQRLAIILVLLFGAVLYGDDNRYKSMDGIPTLIPPPENTAIIDAIYQSQDMQLLSALKRHPEDKHKSIPLSLVWNKPVALSDADYQLAIFDADGFSGFGAVPRVLVLFRQKSKGLEIVTWKEFQSPHGFVFASTIFPLNPAKETHLVTVNSVSKAGGELYFERFNITAQGIEKLGEGANPQMIKKSE
jgi:hypothetical protein